MTQTSSDSLEIVSPRVKAVSAQRAALERRILEGIEGRLQHASLQQCRWMGMQMGVAFFAAGRRRHELAITNVRSSLGVNRVQANRIARRSVQNWGMTMCEFLHMPAMSEGELSDYVSLEGEEHVQAALALGKGVVLLAAHMGNWELLAARIGLNYPVSAVVRPLSNASIQAQISRIRRGADLRLIDKFGAGRPVLKTLRKNEPVVILADRHAGPDGVLLPLFGRLTRFESAPARMAMMSGAPIVPMVGARRGPWLADGRIRGQFFPAFTVDAPTRADREAAVMEGTGKVIANLEELVRKYPDQWTWMLRRWREDDATDAERSLRQLAKASGVNTQKATRSHG